MLKIKAKTFPTSCTSRQIIVDVESPIFMGLTVWHRAINDPDPYYLEKFWEYISIQF